MRALLLAVYLCGLLSATSSSATSVAPSDSTCASIESGLEAQVQTLAIVKDEMGAFRSIFRDALNAVGQCPQSARLWYLTARSAEILDGRFGNDFSAQQGGLATLVGKACAHAQSSVAIATVAARVDGSSASARRALALDDHYAPAQRALAEALAREGAIAAALQVAKPPTGGSASMHLTRARILRLAKRPTEALSEANKIAFGQPDEVTPSVDLYRDTQEVIGFALQDLGRRAEARKALRAAALAGSTSAQQWLVK